MCFLWGTGIMSNRRRLQALHGAHPHIIHSCAGLAICMAGIGGCPINS